MKKNKTMIFLFILPTVLCLLFMYVYPVVRTVIMSFFKVESLTATTSTWSFYGLQNYFKILRNAGFISSMKNMVMIWLVGGIITMCLSMLMAVILTSGIRRRKILQGRHLYAQYHQRRSTGPPCGFSMCSTMIMVC